MRTIIAIVVLWLVVAATTVPAQDIDQALRNMFEHKIATMEDPTTVPEIDVVDFEAFGLVSLDGSITNLQTTGIHNIRLEDIQYNPETMEYVLDVILPDLSFAASGYDLSGRFGGIIPIFGKGPFTVVSNNVRVKGTARLAITGGFVSMASFKSTITMTSLTSNFENLLLGGELGDLMNYIIGDMIPFVVRNQQAEVSAAVEELVLEAANAYLEGKTLEDLRAEVLEFL